MELSSKGNLSKLPTDGNSTVNVDVKQKLLQYECIIGLESFLNLDIQNIVKENKYFDG